jgi:DNA-binding LacI/PurR family transcriptional regulator
VLAQGALRATLEAARKIPRDLSLVAFDDSDWMTFSSPTITTVAQPTQSIGREAATLLLDRLNGDLLGPPVVRELPTRFIRRKSTGPVRKRS